MTLFDFISKFIFFVIPGMITTILFFHLTGKEIPSKIVAIFYVFLASTLSCFGANGIIYIGNHILGTDCPFIKVTEILSGNQYSLTNWGVVFAIAVAVILGFLAAAAAEHNLIFRLAQKLKITNRKDNKDVWDSLFDKEPWVVVRDYVSDHIYQGRVVQYSDKMDLRELLLDDVIVSSEKDNYEVKHVYLSRKPSEFSIELGEYKEEEGREKDEQR